MVKLSSAITSAVVEEYGQTEFLKRISDPYWFQAFACVIGFDWHSSGTTTTACGALKLGVDPKETGILVAGGKGRASKKTQEELEGAAQLFDLGEEEITELKYASRLTAKVDNSCIQDTYQLYHHSFFLSEKGEWAVVQQGMSAGAARNSDGRRSLPLMSDRFARRYHWLSEGVKSFVEEPHSGISSEKVDEKVLDMTSKESASARKVSVDLVNDNPEHLMSYLSEGGQRTLLMPSHHPVLEADIGRGGFEVLRKAYEIQPQNYEELVSLQGMGPKRIRALALISELVYGNPPSWKDPARFSYAHGGKDGFPYPVDRETYDHSIQTLREAVDAAKLEQKEKVGAIRRLRHFLV